MQGLTCWKGRRTLLLLLLTVFPLTNGACEFPQKWEGQWFQSGKPSPVNINATMLGEKRCIEKDKDKYSVYDSLSSENCYRCLIINDRHVNAIQFREVGVCSIEPRSLDDLCGSVTRTDDSLYTMFRLDSKPIPCPFTGAPFTFTYKSGETECGSPISHAESCTDSSKLLLKYQACPDLEFSESTEEELQCLASWRDGRNKYLVGTIKLVGRSGATNEETFRCFLYETGNHHSGEKFTYHLAQSGDSTCSALTAVSEGSRTIKLTKVDKEHGRCKYPSWVTEHHDWRSLDGSKTYHFTSGNATLKVTGVPHEERIVCHNIVEPTDNTQNRKVKLVAHITSGCDIGYVCMIFHRRDGNVIELQQSDKKAVVPEEACQANNLLKMPYTTLITSTLKKKKCPQPGRYRLIAYDSSQNMPTRQRRGIQISQRSAEKMTWSEDSEDAMCNVSDLQIGCGTLDQSEIIIANTCEHKQLVYSCHDSWQEENGVWYTIVSQASSSSSSSSSNSNTGVSGSSSSSSSSNSNSEQMQTSLGRQTFCFSMHWVDPVPKVPGGRGARPELQEQELWLSWPAREFQKLPNDPWTYYRLASQGVCEDLTRASAASSSSLSRVSLVLSAGAAILCKLLSR